MKILTSQSLALCSMVAGLLIAPLGMLADDKHPRPPIDFNQEVRPILSANCFFCHGPDRNHREGGLRLDDRNSAFGAGDSGETAIVPGKPQESEVMRRIHSADPEEQMPHPDAGKTLSPEQIDLLGRWIEEGAVWQEHWAYQQPIRTAVPTVRDPDWCRNWIDHFVLSALESQGRQPSSDAERITLMRRLYFDLTGLPPTPEEVADFLAEKQPQAYEQLVERLLASPHYGERMAMYWLDLVRYADTVGYHGDQDHNISPYRDYVINAFNENMPLDRFTHEQLAGDLIATGNSAQLTEERAIELKIASGYNRLLQTSHEGGVQKKEYLAIYAADRIRNLSGVWMGATMGCCQCHDHKFDPYTTRDFYAMAAFFADVDDEKTFSGANTLPTKREPEMMVFSPSEHEQRAVLAAQIEQLRAQGEPGEPGEPLEKLERQLAALEKRVRRTMITVAVEPRITRVLPRGNWLDETGEVLQPAIPEFLGTLATNGKRADRWDLARWLTDTKTGLGLLTARVFANRCWYLLFGRGLAGPLDDFGGQGTPPSHPALLDALAIRLVESGWDMKQMMKLLVLSRAYQQSSLPRGSLPSEDPENRLFARQSRYRLPAELIRDNALFISGLLKKDLGGDSSRPYQPAGYYRHLNFPERTYTADSDQRQWRRGVYVHWQRQFLHPMLRAFDAPSREECTAERPRSNTPLAALVLLNDPTFLEAARALAERMIREGGPTPRSRIAFAFQLAVSRAPDVEEEELLKNLLRESRVLYRQDPQAAEDLIQIGHRTAAEELEPVELAAWTTVARAVLNLHETITRN